MCYILKPYHYCQSGIKPLGSLSTVAVKSLCEQRWLIGSNRGIISLPLLWFARQACSLHAFITLPHLGPTGTTAGWTLPPAVSNTYHRLAVAHFDFFPFEPGRPGSGPAGWGYDVCSLLPASRGDTRVTSLGRLGEQIRIVTLTSFSRIIDLFVLE